MKIKIFCNSNPAIIEKEVNEWFVATDKKIKILKYKHTAGIADNQPGFTEMSFLYEELTYAS
jgi:hypothetical protein